MRLIDEGQGATNASVSSAGRQVDNVETLDISTIHSDGSADRATSTGSATTPANVNDAATVNAGDFVGVENIRVSSLRSDTESGDTGADGLRVNEIPEDANLTISGSDFSHDVRFSFDTTPDTVSVTLDGAAMAVFQPSTAATNSTVNLTTEGSASGIGRLDLGDSARENSGFFDVSQNNTTTLEIGGSEDLLLSEVVNFGGSSGDARIVDAGDLEGDLTIGLTTTDAFSVTGGSGEDRMEHNLTSATNNELTDEFTAEAVETHIVDKVNADSTVDTENFTGATTVGVQNLGNQVTFEEVAGGTNVQIEGDGVADFDDDFADPVDTATPLADDGNGNNFSQGVTANFAGSGGDPSETATLTINNQGTQLGERNPDGDERLHEVGSIELSNVSEVTVDAQDGSTIVQDLTVGEASDINVSASNDLALGVGADDVGATSGNERGAFVDGVVDLTAGAGAINGRIGAADTLESINAANVSGTFAMALVEDLENDFSFTGGDGGTLLNIGKQDAQEGITVEINTGDGDDTVALSDQIGRGSGSDDEGLELDTGDGDDTLDVANGADISVDNDSTSEIDLGDGNDQITIDEGNTADISGAVLSGLDSIQIAGSATLTIDASNISGNEDDLEILSLGDDTVGFRLDGSDDFDVSELDTTGVDGDDSFEVISGSSDNGITFTATSDGISETYTSLAAGGNGADTITNFEAGADAPTAGGDVLDLSAAGTILDDANPGAIVDVNGASVAGSANDNILFLNSSFKTFDSVGALNGDTALDTGTATFGMTIASGSPSDVILGWEDTDGDAHFGLATIADSGGLDGDVTELVETVGVGQGDLNVNDFNLA